MGPVDANRPFIDGRSFSDIHGMCPDVITDLIYAGMVFSTEFRHPDGKTYGGHVIARDWEHAQDRCIDRPYREKVIGTLEAIIDGPK